MGWMNKAKIAVAKAVAVKQPVCEGCGITLKDGWSVFAMTYGRIEGASFIDNEDIGFFCKNCVAKMPERE